jgi:hypothetical protein
MCDDAMLYYFTANSNQAVILCFTEAGRSLEVYDPYLTYLWMLVSHYLVSFGRHHDDNRQLLRPSDGQHPREQV